MLSTSEPGATVTQMKPSKTLNLFNLFLITIFQWFGLFYILIGLIGIKKTDIEITPIPNYIGNQQLPSSIYKSSVDHVVLLIIDAMRIDFFSHDRLRTVSKLLDTPGNACLFVSNVKAPTVTLPRIKAMVSGEISSYWDVILNFGSGEMKSDNFLSHLSQDLKKKIVFYGDDTWIKLFPNIFQRFEGVSSFYVSDFYEVDNNVTRNMEREMDKKNGDWDFLILHYLGLDHIGHVHGPYHKLVDSKLAEMDSIIRDVYMKLEPGSLLIVSGDHGMANVGGHGGNSEPEVTTPFLVFSKGALPTCFNKDWRDLNKLPNIQQVDLAPTISALYGVMFPSPSVGEIMLELLEHLPFQQQLFSLHYNALQLEKFLDSSDEMLEEEFKNLQGIYEKSIKNPTTEDELIQSYKSLVHSMSESASGKLGEQNFVQMLVGLTLCIQTVFLSFLKLEAKETIFLILSVISLCSNYSFTIGASVFVNCIVIFRSRLTFLKLELLEIHFLVPLIYGSSTYVEEEHYIRYYLFTSILFYLFVFYARKYDISLSGIMKYGYICLICHKIASCWNQTGQKWNELPDLVYYLDELDLIKFISPIAILLIYFLRKSSMSLLSPCLMILVFVLKYTNMYEVCSYFCVIAELLSLNITNAWILLMITIYRYENLLLIPLVLAIAKCSGKLLNLISAKVEIAEILIIWFSHAGFFYQGNSNSIASIDVNSGYIGLPSYNQYIVGFLIFCNTMSVPTLIFLSFAEKNNNRTRTKLKLDKIKLLRTVIKSHAILISIYGTVILALRHHLFIWSVFTPKLLYIISFTIYYCVFLIFPLWGFRMFTRK